MWKAAVCERQLCSAADLCSVFVLGKSAGLIAPVSVGLRVFARDVAGETTQKHAVDF